MPALHDLTDQDLKALAPEAVTQLAVQMLRRLRQQDSELAQRASEIQFKDAKIEKITLQLAQLKAWKFGAKTEAMSAEQRHLFEETFAEDEASLQAQLDQLERARAQAGTPPAADPKPPRKPRRQPLPEHLHRVDHHHEPEDTNCPSADCGREMVRVGEDVSERLDIIPAEFFVHRHIYGKWACRCCQQLVQERAAPQIIEGGMASAGLIAHTMVGHYVDHLPYYRMESINARSSVHTPRSTLASWSGSGGGALVPVVEAHKRFVLSAAVLHADETPVAMLKPGAGKTHRAYLWSYCTTAYNPIRAVVFDFADSRGGQHCRAFLGLPGQEGWHGSLVCDDFSGYKACFELGVSEAGCLAHARRKFHELWVNHQSTIGEQALKFFVQLYEVEREVHDLDPPERQRIRQERSRPVADALHLGLTQQRRKLPEGSATIKAIDYSLNRWAALTRYIDDGNLPADNNWVENQIRPIAIGRSNWLFAGSLRAGQRAAAIMSLVHSARLNGHDPYAYLRDVLERLPTQPASRIDELLPHRWSSTT